MKTGEKLARLKTLASKAGEALFDRIDLAAQVLADKAWLDAEFGGDHDKAMEAIERDYFPELSAFGLSRLLTVLRTFPARADWKQFDFNLMRLWAEHEDREKKAEGDKPQIERRRVKVADMEAAETKIKELEWAVKQARESAQVKESEVERLKRENDELRGEIKALNRMLEANRQRQGV